MEGSCFFVCFCIVAECCRYVIFMVIFMVISRTLHYVARLTCVIHCDSRGLRLASSNRRSKAWLWSWKSVPSRCYGAAGWLHDVTWAYGLGKMTLSQLSPSYLQVISKLSSYPSFLVDLQRHNSDSCIWGCERCRADRCFAGHIYCSLLAASYFPLIPWCSMPTREGSNELHFSIFFRGSTGPTGSTSKQFLWPGRIAPTLLWVATDLQLLSHLAADAADDDGFHATPSVSMLDASSWLQLIAAVLFVGSWQEDFYIFSGLHSCTWQMLGLKVFF